MLAFGTFYVEYNPHTWRHSDEVWSKSTNNYHGISIGFSYFVPFAGAMGIEAGLKGQYLFRNWKEHDMKYNFEMLSATVPVNLALDLEAADGFFIHPYGGLYARYNISARTKEDTKVNDKDRRFTYNWFNKSAKSYSDVLTTWNDGSSRLTNAGHNKYHGDRYKHQDNNYIMLKIRFRCQYLHI